MKINNAIQGVSWRDPISGLPMDLICDSFTPSGVPITGMLKIRGTELGYPIVDSVARVTQESSKKYSSYLAVYGCKSPHLNDNARQLESTVESFGKQWHFAGVMRSDLDLIYRVAKRFNKSDQFFTKKLVLDAGSGAGDQSRWLLDKDAFVISLDLSSAIELTASKLKEKDNWFGIQGDISNLPFNNNSFDIVYCEGVIQHTQDSELTVKELLRVTKDGGEVLATHYIASGNFLNKIRLRSQVFLRERLSKLNEFNLLFYTGVLAKLAYLPLVGWIFRKSSLVLYQPEMPDFKTTWVNTHDCYGSHSYQRVITQSDFESYFIKCKCEIVKSGEGVVVAIK